MLQPSTRLHGGTHSTCRSSNTVWLPKNEGFRGSPRWYDVRKGGCMAFGIEGDVLERAVAGGSGAPSGLLARLRPPNEKQPLRYPVADEDRRESVQATLGQVLRRL